MTSTPGSTLLDSPLDNAVRRAADQLTTFRTGLLRTCSVDNCLKAMAICESEAKELARSAMGNWEVTNAVFLALQQREQALDIIQSQDVGAQA